MIIFTENLRTELQQQHAAELDETSRSHQLQMQAARMELDRAIELSRQKVFNNMVTVK